MVPMQKNTKNFNYGFDKGVSTEVPFLYLFLREDVIPMGILNGLFNSRDKPQNSIGSVATEPLRVSVANC